MTEERRPLRIDEHATYEDKYKSHKRERDAREARKKRLREAPPPPGPLSFDETPEEREAALEQAKGERINPILASDYIDWLMRRTT